MQRRRATWAVLAAAAVAGLAACGGGGGGSAADNGIASKSPAAIMTATRAAMTKVKAAHVAGDIVSAGSSITFDLHLVAGKGGRGHMTQSGLSFNIVVIGDTVYMRGSTDFWKHFGGNAAATLLKGRWLRAKSNSFDLASLASLTDLHKFTTALLSANGKLKIGKRTTVHGQKVVGLDDTTNGGTLFVATTGKPYPIELHKTGKEGGTVIFDRFDEAVSLDAPSPSVDISKLTGG